MSPAPSEARSSAQLALNGALAAVAAPRGEGSTGRGDAAATTRRGRAVGLARPRRRRRRESPPERGTDRGHGTGDDAPQDCHGSLRRVAAGRIVHVGHASAGADGGHADGGAADRPDPAARRPSGCARGPAHGPGAGRRVAHERPPARRTRPRAPHRGHRPSVDGQGRRLARRARERLQRRRGQARRRVGCLRRWGSRAGRRSAFFARRQGSSGGRGATAAAGGASGHRDATAAARARPGVAAPPRRRPSGRRGAAATTSKGPRPVQSEGTAAPPRLL